MPMSPYLAELRAIVGHRLLQVPGVAAVIHDDEGRVLVLRTTSGVWSLPAGAIDPGESPRDAVVREVREESGLEVVPHALLDVLGGPGWRYAYPNGDIVDPTAIVFACTVVGGTLHCDGVETTEARWVAPADVAPMLALPYPARLFDRP